MSLPSLSIGVPNFNHARYLPESLEAIFSQSRFALEIIVIDDASTDESVSVIERYAHRHPGFRLLRHESNLGVNATLTELLGLARGDYFFAPAADDVIYPGLIEKSLRLLASHPQAGLCSAQTDIIDADGRWEGAEILNPCRVRSGGAYIPPENCAAVLWRQRRWILGNTAIFKRRALVEAGGFRSELGPYSDVLAHQIIARRQGACFIPEILGAYRRVPTAYTSRSSRDPEAMRAVRDRVCARMRGGYPDLFSKAYIRRWERRWDFARVRAYSTYKSREWREGMERVLLPGGFGSRVLCLFGKMMLRALVIGLQVLALLLLEWFDLGRILTQDVWQAVRHRRKGLLT